MIGQGSPNTSLGQFVPTVSAEAVYRGARLALVMLLALLARGPLAAGETIRVRIAWGGGAERLWRGTISLSQGSLSQPRTLGIEADEPGSMWLDTEGPPGGDKLVVRQRSPRSYDGVDLLIDAPADARLAVQLAAADDDARPAAVEIPLSDLSGRSQEKFYNRPLDKKGNRLLVRRTPGDKLRVHLARDSLVFSPGEEFKFTLQPHLLPLEPDSRVLIKVRLAAPASGNKELWSAEHNARAGRPAAIPLNVRLPEEEGVYDVVITATHKPNWRQAVRRPLSWKHTVAQRKIQVVVLGPRRAAPPTAAGGELKQVVQIDPANSRWWEDLLDKLPKIPNIPSLRKGPLGNGNMKVVKHPLGQLVRLNPNRQSPDVSWQAYSLPIDRPGRPHVLEVDYPSDVSQTMGISILEPNAAGALMPIGLDSGVDRAKEITQSGRPPRWMRHRLIFWPRTTAPMVLITNRRDGDAAMYGKIRVLAGWVHLPRAFPADDSRLRDNPREARQSQRLLAAYLDRPLFPENFSAGEVLDGWSRRSLDDWGTFHQGGTRLVEYLQHVGYNGLMISVLADGSTIYPSKTLQPTPRYDTGAFFASAQDPVRKDVLEMLFRLFDREGLQLIPTIEFAAPLPELEAIKRREKEEGGRGKGTIEWIGPEGAAWTRIHPIRRGLAPYYNLLEPRVQEAMLRVVRELIGRYAHHPSFGGLGVQLSAHGYAQLPGPDWGMDDDTIARFERDEKVKVPGTGPDRFAQRAAFLGGPKHRRQWLTWRAGQLSRFYGRVSEEVTAARDDGRLFLAGAGTLGGVEMEDYLRPKLTRRTTLAEALLQVGIDARLLAQDKHLVLLRSGRVVPTGHLAERAVNLEIKQMADVDRYFQDLPVPAHLFFSQPQEARIASFDRQSPFQPAYTWLVTQPVPSDRQNRRRFVHSLAAMDTQVLIDGGWMLPLGQEESVRDLLAAYRRLPAVRFQRVDPQSGAASSQPVTFRYASCGGATYVYAANDAPFPTTARVRLTTRNEGPGAGGEIAPLAPGPSSLAAGHSPPTLKELTGMRQVAPLLRDGAGTYWTVELGPYDLVAVRLSAPGVQLSEPQVSLPEDIPAALSRRIRELGARAAALRSPLPLEVFGNPGFERPPKAAEPVPGWAVTNRLGVAVEVDKTQKHGGKASARITSNGPVGCLVGRPFDAPTTGRLSMSVWLRVADPTAQPPLRLALEGKLNGQPYYRFAPIGLAPNGAQAAVPIGTEWTRYVFQVDDLPLGGLSQLRVRFDLMGPGKVWIDDVKLFDLAFNRNEQIELSKLITLADVKLANREVYDCIRVLEGYWPRFLEEHVPLAPLAPLAPPAPAVAEAPDAEKPSKQPPPRTGRVEGVRSWLPEFLRF